MKISYKKYKRLKREFNRSIIGIRVRLLLNIILIICILFFLESGSFFFIEDNELLGCIFFGFSGLCLILYALSSIIYYKMVDGYIKENK